MMTKDNIYTNFKISEYLQNIATAYEIKNQTKFQISAYQNAADSIQNYPQNIYELWQKDIKLLDAIPNIGPSILKKIDHFFKTGKDYPSLKKIFLGIHPAVFTLTKVNGIGPIIAHKLTQQLRFSQNPTKALEQLISFSQRHKIQKIPTFGVKSEESILNNTLAFLGRQKRMTFSQANTLANKIIRYLNRKFPTVKFEVLGSLRRHSSTVGDIDIAAAAIKPQPIITHFLNYPGTIQIIAHGKNKATIRLPNDIHADLMVKPPQSFGSLLQHFTGSKQHNILLRKHALKLGFSLSEYGIRDIKTKKLFCFDNEEKFYNFLQLRFIPPQERVGDEELEIYKML